MQTIRFVRFFRHLNITTVKKIVARSGQQRLPGLAAEIAFNAILAMFPAIVAVLTVVGMLGSSQRTLEQLSEQLIQYAPEEVLKVVESFIQELSPASSQSLLSVSFVAAIWVASAAVSSIMNALDQIHRVPPHQTRPFWKAKLVSLWLTFGTILLLVVASVMVFLSDIVVRVVATEGDQIVESIAKRPNIMEPQLLTFWSRLSMPIALSMVAIAFAFIYRFGPSRRFRGTPILPGAVLATIFWAIFSGIFRLYVSNFGSYNRVYGTVGAIIVLLVWLQLGALTMLIGAQLNVTVGEEMREKPLGQKPSRSLAYVAQDGEQNAEKNQHPKKRSRNEA